MRIAYINYNMSVQLVREKARATGDFKYFMTLMEGLLHDKSVKVDLYTSMDKASENAWNKDRSQFGMLNSDRFSYTPDARDINPDTDLVYINGGPNNLMYGDKYWKISSIAKCFKLLKSYKGLVFINPGEVELEISFLLENFHPKMFLYENNVSTADILKDKRIVVLTKAYNSTTFLDECSSYRNMYKDLKLDVEFFNDSVLGSIDFKPLPMREECEFRFSYVGNRRLSCGSYRYNLVKNTLEDVPESHIWGDWSSSDFKEGTKIINHGKLSYGDLESVINNTRFSPVFTDEAYEKDRMKLLTNRVFEIIQCGSIPILHHKIDVSHIIPNFPRFLTFEDSNSLIKISDEIEGKGVEYMKTLVSELQKSISGYNDEYITLKLLGLYKKWKDKPVAPYLDRYYEVLSNLLDPNKIENYSDLLFNVSVRELFKNLCNSDLTISESVRKDEGIDYEFLDKRICKKCSIVLKPVVGMGGRSKICTSCGGSANIEDGSEKFFPNPIEFYKTYFSKLFSDLLFEIF